MMESLFSDEELSHTEVTFKPTIGRSRYESYGRYKRGARLQTSLGLPCNLPSAVRTRFGCAEVVVDAQRVREWLDAHPAEQPLGLDLETYGTFNERTQQMGSGLDVLTCGIAITALSYGFDDTLVCVHQNTELSPEEVFQLIESRPLVVFNAGFDIAIMARVLGRMPRVHADTQVAFGMLTAGLRPPFEKELSLNGLCQRYLNISLRKSVRKQFVDVAFVDQAVLEYAAEDVAATIHCYYLLEEELRRHELYDLFVNLEMQVLPVVIRMTMRGLDIDVQRILEIKEQLHERADEIAQELIQMKARPDRPFSPTSRNDVMWALRTEGIQVTNVDKRTLRKYMDNPFVRTFSRWRKIHTLFSSQFRPWVERHMHPNTGRIHPQFTLTHTDTGRLSSRNPNGQNIAKEKGEGEFAFLDVRRCFVASPGGLLITADYSQYELRILAEISGDERMIREFLDEWELLLQFHRLLQQHDIAEWEKERIQDLISSSQEASDLAYQLKLADKHRRTAGMLFGKSPADVTDAERSQAKGVSFGVVYGMGARTLAETLSASMGKPVSEEYARDLLDAFFKGYPGVYRYIRSTEQQVRSQGYTTTLIGRKRFYHEYLFPETEVSRTARTADYRAAVNARIQGTNADVIKLALIELHRQFEHDYPDRYPVLTIHDEIVVVSPQQLAIETAHIVRDCMVRASSTVMHRVPTVVSVAVAPYWSK